MKLDYEEFARDVDTLPAEKLSHVSELAQRMQWLDQQIIGLADKVRNATDERRMIAERRLPDAMSALGVLELKLKDGSMISIETNYHAKIPAQNEIAAFQWLRKNGFDSLIKNEFKAVFGKGEDEQAKIFLELAKEHDVAMKSKTEVHPQTLRAFVKEQAEAGHPVPDDLFGVHIINQAQIRR